MPHIEIPNDLDSVLDDAWESAQRVPGFLLEHEARFLGAVAACIRGTGAIVEIGSFKGKSAVMLAKVAKHYSLGPVVAIDPHNFNNAELARHRTDPAASSYEEFLQNLQSAGVLDLVKPLRAYASDVAKTWTSPIGLLWIDGDHSYRGAKSDYEGFSPYMAPYGIVALHDALHPFSGPIRVFIEDILRSEKFGAAGFVHSIAWSQFRPVDGSKFAERRAQLDGCASRLLPFVKDDGDVRGLDKLRFKLNRARIPRGFVEPSEWVELLGEKG